MSEQWREFDRQPGEHVRYRVDRALVDLQTRFQHLEIVDTATFGRALFLDGKPQSAAIDEFVYHEGLVHPAMVTCTAARTVFIAGGGEGATLREVLRHQTVERVVMVDIDGEAVDFCRTHLPDWHNGAFDDPRVELCHEDARAYLQQHDDTYDVIVVDITDPIAGGPSYLLFTTEFYQIARGRLRPGGVLVTQAESAALNDLEAHLAIVTTLASVFPLVRSYSVNVPYYADAWAFGLASAGADPWALTPAEVDTRLGQRGCDGLRFYDGLAHQGLAGTPKYLRDRLRNWTRTIRDAEPLLVE